MKQDPARSPTHSHRYVYALRRTHVRPALQHGAVAQVESVPQMATPPHTAPAGATCFSSGHLDGPEGKPVSGSDNFWVGGGTTLTAALVPCLRSLGGWKAAASGRLVSMPLGGGRALGGGLAFTGCLPLGGSRDRGGWADAPALLPMNG
jgi:hypothetical protein